MSACEGVLLSQFPIVLLSQILHMSAELSIRKTGGPEHFRSVPHPFIDIAYRQISFEETHTYIHTYFLISLIPGNCFEYPAEVQSHFLGGDYK